MEGPVKEVRRIVGWEDEVVLSGVTDLETGVEEDEATVDKDRVLLFNLSLNLYLCIVNRSPDSVGCPVPKQGQ